MKNYQDMVVIFLDILGSKNRTDFQDKYNVHELFHNEVRLHEDRQRNLSHVIYDRKVYSFSDCAYIFYYYKDGIVESRKNDENLIFIAVNNTCLSVLKFLSQGYLVRGGISFGKAFFDDIGFFGPAVEQAYEVESKLALYPRLMFDDATGKKVFNWEQNLERDPISLEMFKEMPFLTEFDGTSYFANTFFSLVKHGHTNLEDRKISLDEIKQVILQTVSDERKKNSNDERVLEKLNWIEQHIVSKRLLLDESKVTGLFNFVPLR